MKRKIVVFFGTLLIIFFLPQCRGWKEYYSITGINLDFCVRNPNPNRNPVFLSPEKWEESIIIEIRALTEWESSNSMAFLFNNFSTVTSCMAWQGEEIYRNRMIKESFLITFDTDISYNGLLIPANTDLLTFPVFKDKIGSFGSEKDYLYFEFKESLFSNIRFEKESFDVFVECQTSDGLILSATKEAKVDPAKLIEE